MGDAIHLNVAQLLAAGTDLVAGYVTGTPDIAWTLADFQAAFDAGKIVVTIDQGGIGSPVPVAQVRDVEAGAWTPAAAVSAPWTAARPTIYISLASLPELEQAGWRGDVWVADWTGTPPASPPPVPAGMTCVAQQYSDQGGGGAYDLSVVFDPAWPAKGDPMAQVVAQAGNQYCSKCLCLVSMPNAVNYPCAAGGSHVVLPGWQDLAVLVAQ